VLYFRTLRDLLADGLDRLDADRRERHLRFVLSLQRPDGGFAGRSGPSDLYYTAFAVRILAADGGKGGHSSLPAPGGPERASQKRGMSPFSAVEEFLQTHPPTTIVELASWLSIASDLGGGRKKGTFRFSRPRRPGGCFAEKRNVPFFRPPSALLESFRTPDGGYGQRPGAQTGSTYLTFLAVQCYGLLGAAGGMRNAEGTPRNPHSAFRIPHFEEAVSFVRSRRRPDGGFAELAVSRHSSTNATAAGAALLAAAGHHAANGVSPLDVVSSGSDPVFRMVAGVARYLASIQTSSGGWPATRLAPAADLLSTFTALFTLRATLRAAGDNGVRPQREDITGTDPALAGLAQDAARFVLSCERPTGGFSGSPLDPEADIEYTHYGLACLALVAI
jgi:geranylgeranyl transferase type-2 subunit beta